MQGTEKRLLCLKIQITQTTQTTLATTARTAARITARTQVQIILTHLAATQGLINQAMLITVAKMLITQAAAIKVPTAALTHQNSADKF